MYGLYFNGKLAALFMGIEGMEDARKDAQECMYDWVARGDRSIYNKDTLKVRAWFGRIDSGIDKD